MTRANLATAALAAAVLSTAPLAAAHAQPVADGAPAETVARTFIAAAQSQDRQAALKLLDKKVSISFTGESLTGQAAQPGHGEGQPFVIGYLDGLFYGQRAVSVEDGGAARGATVRFMAHDARFHDHYAIDVEVKDAHVIRVTVHLEPQASVGQAVASLGPS
jgi:opacity protein-like surface antigen